MDHKIAVITGASRGLGFAMADNLAAQGYSLALISRNEITLEQVKKNLQSKFNNAIDIFPIDVANKQHVDQAIDQVLSKFKNIDLLFNNAAILHAGTSALEQDKILELININLLGAINLIQAVVPAMKQQKSGYI